MDDFPVLHLGLEAARDRGWNGETRMVNATGIKLALAVALRLINRVDQVHFPAPTPGGEVENSHNALVCMERAANLLRRAAEDLDDERLRLRDGWPV